jgi:hypothetical protein
MKIRKIHIFIAAVTLAVTIFGSWWYVETTEASIDYWLEEKQSFGFGRSSIKIYCQNGGKNDGDFYLYLTFVNASFSNQTKQPYTELNSSTVRFHFLLHEGDFYEKQVFFSPYDDVNGFSIKLTFEKITFFLKSQDRHPTELTYERNEDAIVFNLIE